MVVRRLPQKIISRKPSEELNLRIGETYGGGKDMHDDLAKAIREVIGHRLVGNDFKRVRPPIADVIIIAVIVRRVSPGGARQSEVEIGRTPQAALALQST